MPLRKEALFSLLNGTTAAFLEESAIEAEALALRADISALLELYGSGAVNPRQMLAELVATRDPIPFCSAPLHGAVPVTFSLSAEASATVDQSSTIQIHERSSFQSGTKPRQRPRIFFRSIPVPGIDPPDPFDHSGLCPGGFG